MKKITILLIALLPVLAQAQVTPEAIMGQCPPFPSQQDIVGAMMSRDTAASVVDNYLKMLDAAIAQSDASLEKARKSRNLEGKSLNDADKAVQKQLGISLDKAQNMSEAELERMAQKKADEALKKMGIRKSAKELENQELSEAEQQQIADAMAKQTTGMSVKELEALSAKLENMSEEQQIAYMRSGGKAQKIAAKAGKRPAVDMKNIDTDALSFQYSEQWQANAQKLLEIEHGQNDFETRLRERWVTDGYQSRTAPLMKQISEVTGNTQAEVDSKVAALEARIAVIREEYCRASVKEWYPYIMRKLSIIKQMLQEDKMSDARAVEAAKMGGLESGEVLGATSGAAIARALQYLETAKELVAAPGAGELIPVPNS